MKQIAVAALGMLLLGVPSAIAPVVQAQAGGWKTILAGTDMKGWTPIGGANWHVVDGTVQGDNNMPGFLVSQESYGDFELRAEFWVSADANSGIFIRCSNPKEVTAANSYEVNIFDTRPDPAYRTGGIVDVAKPASMVNAGNRWNTYEISAKGQHLVVRLNGMLMVDVMDGKHARGPIALQSSAGTVRFRNVQIR